MPHTPFVIADLDGTLLHDAERFEDRALSARTLETVHAVRSRGIPVVVATARPVSTGLSIVQALHADACIYLNGALIDFDPSQSDYASLTGHKPSSPGSLVKNGFDSQRACEVCRAILSVMQKSHVRHVHKAQAAFKLFLDNVLVDFHRAGGVRHAGRVVDKPDVKLQSEADRWRRHFCARAEHSRLKTTRNAAWLTIKEEQLRTVPRDVLEAIAQWKEERRNVGTDFTISVDTRTHYGVRQYDLRELAYHGLSANESVRVLLNPFKAPEIVAVMDMPDGTEKRFNIAPMEKPQYIAIDTSI